MTEILALRRQSGLQRKYQTNTDKGASYNYTIIYQFQKPHNHTRKTQTEPYWLRDQWLGDIFQRGYDKTKT